MKTGIHNDALLDTVVGGITRIAACYRIAATLECRTLHWRHNDHDGVSNHQPHDYLLNRLFRCRSKKTSKLCVTGLCAENSPGTGEFPAQMVSNAENVAIWWRHHEYVPPTLATYHGEAATAVPPQIRNNKRQWTPINASSEKTVCQIWQRFY